MKTKIAAVLLSSVLLGISAIGQASPPPPINGAANPAITGAVGIAASDGITISGLDVLVTRNGVTEKLRHELTLADGTRVQPDGAVITPAGAKVMLRPDQVLTFEGRFVQGDATQTSSRK